MTMTLEKVRDVLINEAEWYESRLGDYKIPDFRAMADAIDAHLTTHPEIPVSAGEAVACAEVVTDPSTGNRLLVSYFANGVTPDIGTKLYTIPAEFRVVPVEPTEAMIAKGTDQHVCEQMDSYYKDTELTDTDCIAIYKAMLAAAPDAGGV